MEPEYVVQIEFNDKLLKENYPKDNYLEAYEEIRSFLTMNKFEPISNTMYVCSDYSPVTATIIIQKLSDKFYWFKNSLSRLRLLRVTDDNDLSIAL